MTDTDTVNRHSRSAPAAAPATSPAQPGGASRPKRTRPAPDRRYRTETVATGRAGARRTRGIPGGTGGGPGGQPDRSCRPQRMIDDGASLGHDGGQVRLVDEALRVNLVDVL